MIENDRGVMTVMTGAAIRAAGRWAELAVVYAIRKWESFIMYPTAIA